MEFTEAESNLAGMSLSCYFLTYTDLQIWWTSTISTPTPSSTMRSTRFRRRAEKSTPRSTLKSNLLVGTVRVWDSFGYAADKNIIDLPCSFCISGYWIEQHEPNARCYRMQVDDLTTECKMPRSIDRRPELLIQLHPSHPIL